MPLTQEEGGRIRFVFKKELYERAFDFARRPLLPRDLGVWNCRLEPDPLLGDRGRLEPDLLGGERSVLGLLRSPGSGSSGSTSSNSDGSLRAEAGDSLIRVE